MSGKGISHYAWRITELLAKIGKHSDPIDEVMLKATQAMGALGGVEKYAPETQKQILQFAMLSEAITRQRLTSGHSQKVLSSSEIIVKYTDAGVGRLLKLNQAIDTLNDLSKKMKSVQEACEIAQGLADTAFGLEKINGFLARDLVATTAGEFCWLKTTRVLQKVIKRLDQFLKNVAYAIEMVERMRDESRLNGRMNEFGGSQRSGLDGRGNLRSRQVTGNSRTGIKDVAKGASMVGGAAAVSSQLDVEDDTKGRVGPRERTYRDALNGIVIESEVKSPPGRQGFEKKFWPGVELGLEGWERAHSQGNITGKESAEGIRYAPREVNQHFQRLGIERFIRELHQEKSDDVRLFLTTVTYTHSNTLRLKEIQYKIDAWRDNQKFTLFEAAIEVQDKKQSPRITPTVELRLDRDQWRIFLKSRPGPIHVYKKRRYRK